jgi:hypothetical protein
LDYSNRGSSLHLAQRARKKLEEKMLEKIEGSELFIRTGSGLEGISPGTISRSDTEKKEAGKSKA